MSADFDADRHAQAHARFAYDDAAYVLGGLSPDDQAAFEAHLADCPLCQAQVAELAGLPKALSVADPSNWTSESPPSELLPRLLWQVSAQRRTRRVRSAVLGLVAACLLSVLSLAGLSAWHSSQLPPSRSFTAVDSAAATVQATARLTSTGSGTLLQVKCGHYTAGANGYRGPARPTNIIYRLVVINRSGAEQVPTSWSPDRDIVVDTSTNWPRSAIRALEIQDASGTPILRLQL